MNRILFEQEEIHNRLVTFGGERAEHVLTVLHGEVGQTLKTGEVNGLIGTSVITAIENGQVTVRVTHESAALEPWVDLILAPPRPRVMKRLLPQLTTLGVGTIVLVGAQKVEKDFWGATLLKEETYRPLLIDGLMQAGTTRLPVLKLQKSFKRYLKTGLPEFADAVKIVAHPGEQATPVALPRTGRLCLAIGPEGGWTDEEVSQLEVLGFARYSLGSRILRTDTAAIALLAQLMKEYSA